jgi:anthraniloyl-CoA monooxygenase
MKVAIIGGGPAGLYTALLLKNADPRHQVAVYERNRANDTFGWGVVFSDQTLENFRLADAPTYSAITENFAHWDDIDVFIHGRRITSGGHGFSGIGRKKLLEILQSRASDLGVDVHFCSEILDDSELDADLIVAADGINSVVRKKYAKHFKPDLDERTARFIWLGTTYPFDAFTFYFVENQHGVFQAHCYRFDDRTSTFIVECDEKSWRSAGFDRMDVDETIAACEEMFAEWLDGHHLMSNASHRAQSPWINFVRVRNETWHHGNVVLIGDAAHSAHFSIGSGTKLAMEDAIGLVHALSSHDDLFLALKAYQEDRGTEALRLQNAARNSMEWFENVKRYIHLEPEQFAYSLLTRSQRVSHENLRMRDATYVQGMERWIASRASISGGDETPPPPMFTPFTLREMTLHNRVIVSPMDMYSAVDGVPNDFHLVHLGARALGGAALVMTEMVCVSPEARITLGCTGLYNDEQLEAWTRIVRFVHEWTDARICLQLGHSGRKGSVKLPWEGTDIPLDTSWERVGPSALEYGPTLPPPREMTRADMDVIKLQFVRAAELGEEAGFDMIELHCAHGYLLSSFLTPISNRRTDEYGGSVENRLRYPIEIFSEMRAIWPESKPMSVRVSATDWVEDGLTTDESVQIGKAFVAAGADVIHVSTGQTVSNAKPVFGRLWQTPFSDRIRNEGRVPTIAVGNITEADQVNSIIAAGRADLVAIGRPHLSDPQWTLRAAAQLGYNGARWPVQYYQGRTQMEREFQRARETKKP